MRAFLVRQIVRLPSRRLRSAILLALPDSWLSAWLRDDYGRARLGATALWYHQNVRELPDDEVPPPL